MELSHEHEARAEHASAEARRASGCILLPWEPSRNGENTAPFRAESKDPMISITSGRVQKKPCSAPEHQ